MHDGRVTQAAIPCPNAVEWHLWDRRGFLTAVSAATVALAAGTATAAPMSAAGMIVADRRIAESAAFATEAARSGGRVAWISGDITEVWYDELDPLWHREKTIVAGLTAYGVFFCLERLAMDRGLRVAFRGEHRRLRSGALQHAIHGPERIVTRDAIAGLSDDSWPAQTARLAMAVRGAEPLTACQSRHKLARPAQPSLLVSWVIAPRHRIQGSVT